MHMKSKIAFSFLLNLCLFLLTCLSLSVAAVDNGAASSLGFSVPLPVSTSSAASLASVVGPGLEEANVCAVQGRSDRKSATQVTNNCQERYVSSDLAIGSQNFGVRFYHRTNNKDMESYATAVIYTEQSRIGNIILKKFSAGPLHYLCLDPEERYADLPEFLKEMETDILGEKETIVKASPKATPLPSSSSGAPLTASFEAVITALSNADTVYITFGAGLSAPYVPTLQGFFQSLGLKQALSQDAATDESLAVFVQRMVAHPTAILSIVRQEWDKVRACTLESTPAHQALRDLAALLTSQGKRVFIYTDNIDGIHHKVGIKLAESETPMGHQILYEKLGKKNVVLVCGQSFDFHGILGTIYSRRAVAESLELFSLNIAPTPIMVRDGLDIDKIADNELVDLESFPQCDLPMRCLLGSLQEILPALLKRIL